MIRKLFNSIFKPNNDIKPIIGKIYQHKDYFLNPFSLQCCIKVLNVKNDYVLYVSLNPETLKPFIIYKTLDSMKIETFNFIYVKTEYNESTAEIFNQFILKHNLI